MGHQLYDGRVISSVVSGVTAFGENEILPALGPNDRYVITNWATQPVDANPSFYFRSGSGGPFKGGGRIWATFSDSSPHGSLMVLDKGDSLVLESLDVGSPGLYFSCTYFVDYGSTFRVWGYNPFSFGYADMPSGGVTLAPDTAGSGYIMLNYTVSTKTGGPYTWYWRTNTTFLRTNRSSNVAFAEPQLFFSNSIRTDISPAGSVSLAATAIVVPDSV